MSAEVWGIAAEYADPDSLVEAASAAREAGYRRFEAYSPYPIRQLEHVVPDQGSISPLVFLGGLLGFLTAWAMEFYIAVIDYPINVGGRPLNSWPAFIVIMFELTILFSAISAFVWTLVFCGFPRPHHPVFNIPRFADTSNSRFFLCIEARDPLFDEARVADLLSEFDPLEVVQVHED